MPPAVLAALQHTGVERILSVSDEPLALALVHASLPAAVLAAVFGLGVVLTLAGRFRHAGPRVRLALFGAALLALLYTALLPAQLMRESKIGGDGPVVLLAAPVRLVPIVWPRPSDERFRSLPAWATVEVRVRP